MRRSTILLMSVIFAVSVVSAAYAGTRITMKNGRTFVVGECNETKTSLTCEMYGGMIELDKSDIESIEGVKYTPGYYEDGPSQDEPSSDEKKPEATKQEGSSGQVPGQQGMEVKGLSPDQRKRLAQINEKKTVLKTEREKILQERDRLNEEIKNAGIIRKQEDVDEFRRRLAESEAKIREFNEEVRRLNDEESILFGESSAPKQP